MKIAGIVLIVLAIIGAFTTIWVASATHINWLFAGLTAWACVGLIGTGFFERGIDEENKDE